MKFLLKKWVAILSAIAIVAVILPYGAPVHAAGGFNIFNVSFTGLVPGNYPPPGFTYLFAGTNENNYSLVSGVFGKETEDVSLKMQDAAYTSGTHYLGLEGAASLQNASPLAAGEKLLLSVEIAKEDYTDSSYIDVSLAGKNGLGEVSTIGNPQTFFKMDKDATYFCVGVPDTTQGYRYELRKWYRVDMLFTEGSNLVSFYVNGKWLKTSDFSGWMSETTFAGITGNVRIRTKHENRTNPTTMYIDNFSLNKFPANYPIFPQYDENFDGYVSNTVRNFNGYSYGYFTKDITTSQEKGVFGKDQNDVSVRLNSKLRMQMAETTDSTNPCILSYPYSGQKFRYGDTVYYGLSFARDDYDISTYFHLTMRARTNGAEVVDVKDGLNMAVKASQGALSAGNGTKTAAVNWIPKKWYRLELIFYPGDGISVKNKYQVYLDGKLMIDDVEFDADKTVPFSQLESFGQTRFALEMNNGNKIPGTATGRAQTNLYIDDVRMNYAADTVGAPFSDGAVSVTSSSPFVNTNYHGALLLSNAMTVSELRAAITVSGVQNIQFLDITGTALQEADMVANGYLRLEKQDGTTYYFNISNKIVFYQESFSEYDIIQGNAYQFWGGTKKNGEFLSAKGLAGRESTDQSFKLSFNNWGKSEDVNGGYIDKVVFSNSKRLRYGIASPFTMELSLAASENDSGAFHSASIGYNYTDNNGDEHEVSITDLIQLKDGLLYLGANKVLSGRYSDGQWNKFSFVISPQTASMDVYQNGVKIGESIGLSTDPLVMENASIIGINRLKIGSYRNNAQVETVLSGYLAVDDILFYAGDYANFASKDVIGVSDNENYDLSLTGNICIKHMQNEELPLSTFNSEVSFTGDVKRLNFYDDETLTENNMYDMIWHGQYIVVTAQGGAIHYFRLVDATKATDFDSVKLRRTNGSIVSPELDVLEIGDYQVIINAEKYNAEPETATVCFAVYGGNRLVTFKTFALDLMGGKNEYAVPVVLEELDNDTIVKAFLWKDLNDIKPLAGNLTWGN